MAFDLSLLDLITPYVLRRDTFGPWHAALSTPLVREHDVAVDDAGLVICGAASFEGAVRPFIHPSRVVMGIQGEIPRSALEHLTVPYGTPPKRIKSN